MLKNKYRILRKILIPLSYSIILLAISTIIYEISLSKPFEDNTNFGKNYQGSIIPIKTIDTLDDFEFPIANNTVIKGLSYFTLAKDEKTVQKKYYYLKTIRTLTKALSTSLKGESDAKINSILYFHLAYSYILFGEEYFSISLKYLLQAEKMNKIDNLLSQVSDSGKLYLLDLYEIVGSIYFQLGRFENTIEYILKAKIINNNIYYDLLLAYSYYEINEYRESYNYFKNILYNFDNTGLPKKLKQNIILGMSMLLYLNENYFESIDYINKYIKNYEDSAEIRYQLGKIYETLSFKEKNDKKQKEYINKAINEWKKSIKLQANYGKPMLKLLRYNAKL